MLTSFIFKIVFFFRKILSFLAGWFIIAIIHWTRPSIGNRVIPFIALAEDRSCSLSSSLLSFRTHSLHLWSIITQDGKCLEIVCLRGQRCWRGAVLQLSHTFLSALDLLGSLTVDYSKYSTHSVWPHSLLETIFFNLICNRWCIAYWLLWNRNQC